MKKEKLLVIICLEAFILLTFCGCSTVPMTGRQQLTLIPESSLMATSFSQYDQFLNENKVIKSGADADMVKEVGERIAESVEMYLSEIGHTEQTSGFEWEFNLVDDPTPNAWCMSGGKVVVYSGLLPIAQDADGLAVVMGHEIAHAVARHGSERMSQQMFVQYGGMALDAAFQQKPEETKAMWMQAFGITTQLGAILPYSRKHELEADEMGLTFMAKAGYDPNAAIPFWQRMSALGSGDTPSVLSTHPSDEKRISQIQSLLPEAMKHYEAK